MKKNLLALLVVAMVAITCQLENASASKRSLPTTSFNYLFTDVGNRLLFGKPLDTYLGTLQDPGIGSMQYNLYGTGLTITGSRTIASGHPEPLQVSYVTGGVYHPVSGGNIVSGTMHRPDGTTFNFATTLSNI